MRTQSLMRWIFIQRGRMWREQKYIILLLLSIEWLQSFDFIFLWLIYSIVIVSIRWYCIMTGSITRFLPNQALDRDSKQHDDALLMNLTNDFSFINGDSSIVFDGKYISYPKVYYCLCFVCLRWKTKKLQVEN